MKFCSRCREDKPQRAYQFNNSTGRYSSACKDCESNRRKELKRLRGQSTLEDYRKRVSLKYQSVIDFKRQHPEICWADICKKFSVNYYACRTYLRTWKVEVQNSGKMKIRNIGQPRERWKRSYHLAYMRNYFKTVYKYKKLQYDRRYRASHREQDRSYKRKYQAKAINGIYDSYVRCCLAKGTSIPQQDFQSEIVDIKREQIKLKRLLKEKNT